MKLLYLRDLVQVYRQGEYFGDLAILKSAINELQPANSIREWLDHKKHFDPDFCEINFENMPEGSFGRSYDQFMKKHHLKPLKFSGHYQDLMRKHFFAVYYAVTHDLFHVITGFDTSLAGEAGVWGFVAGQGYGKDCTRAWKATKIFYPIVAPHQTRSILQAANRGYEMGQNAKTVLFADFRQLFPQPLSEVRHQLMVEPF